MRVAFLVDGFNLYHSLDEAAKHGGGSGTKWLNLRAFCASYLPQIGRQATLGPVHYFSALAKHRIVFDPGVTQRHGDYIECLKDSGVIVELGHFKQKWITCSKCGRELIKHEEKETDVAIGVRLVELLWSRHCDAAAIVSADSDLAPAIRTAKRMFPGSPIYIVRPWNRKSYDLFGLADLSFKATLKGYTTHQFPDPYTLITGTISKPVAW